MKANPNPAKNQKMFVLFKIAMKSKFPTMVKSYLKFSGWCTNCEGTWSTGNDGKLAKYALVQEVQAWWYGGYDHFHLAEVQFRTGRHPFQSVLTAKQIIIISIDARWALLI